MIEGPRPSRPINICATSQRGAAALISGPGAQGPRNRPRDRRRARPRWPTGRHRTHQRTPSSRAATRTEPAADSSTTPQTVPERPPPRRERWWYSRCALAGTCSTSGPRSPDQRPGARPAASRTACSAARARARSQDPGRSPTTAQRSPPPPRSHPPPVTHHRSRCDRTPAPARTRHVTAPMDPASRPRIGGHRLAAAWAGFRSGGASCTRSSMRSTTRLRAGGARSCWSGRRESARRACSSWPGRRRRSAASRWRARVAPIWRSHTRGGSSASCWSRGCGVCRLPRAAGRSPAPPRWQGLSCCRTRLCRRGRGASFGVLHGLYWLVAGLAEQRPQLLSSTTCTGPTAPRSGSSSSSRTGSTRCRRCVGGAAAGRDRGRGAPSSGAALTSMELAPLSLRATAAVLAERRGAPVSAAFVEACHAPPAAIRC